MYIIDWFLYFRSKLLSLRPLSLFLSFLGWPRTPLSARNRMASNNNNGKSKEEWRKLASPPGSPLNSSAENSQSSAMLSQIPFSDHNLRTAPYKIPDNDFYTYLLIWDGGEYVVICLCGCTWVVSCLVYVIVLFDNATYLTGRYCFGRSLHHYCWCIVTINEGSWKRNLEWREFGNQYQHLRTSNTVVLVGIHPVTLM